jgi:hypothetical protein
MGRRISANSCRGTATSAIADTWAESADRESLHGIHGAGPAPATCLSEPKVHDAGWRPHGRLDPGAVRSVLSQEVENIFGPTWAASFFQYVHSLSAMNDEGVRRVPPQPCRTSGPVIADPRAGAIRASEPIFPRFLLPRCYQAVSLCQQTYDPLLRRMRYPNGRNVVSPSRLNDRATPRS